jgi:tritrans,polycis-undecaprenyl-diphosphate synthase [geranylgeranyl-diphosphate specific]
MLRGLLSALGIYELYHRWLRYQIKSGKRPEHIGVILDGNRRWARASPNDTESGTGHPEGAKKVEEFLKWCLNLEIKTVTLYVFSTENFQRSKEEVEEIMDLAEEYLRRIINDETIHKYRVRIKALGRLNMLPESLQRKIRSVEEQTKGYDRFYLNVAIAYGGRAEIIDATREIAREVAEGKTSLEKIDETLFEKHLYTSHLPQQDPDLIIRTSGESRLSGFLLWQSAYSELFFLDVYWPDFREIDLERAIRTYGKRERRLGK